MQHAAGGPGGLDARQAVAAVADATVRVAELVADARERCARWEPWLGAVVSPVEPAAGGLDGPLHGVVAGVKDLLAVAGLPRGCGAPGLVDPSPQPGHATAVARLTDAGAAVVATLALHQLAYGLVTPQTRNPRAPDRIAGGSSGGSAAALAAGLVHLALGTDTGGSVRVPAACCGVVGLKTTRGLVPLTGTQPLAWSLDTIGPLAATVADVALGIAALAGADAHDPDSDPAAGTLAPRSPRTDPRGLRIGVPVETEQARIDPDVRAVWERCRASLADAGAEVVHIELPSLAEASRSAGLVLAAEALAVHSERLETAPRAWWPDVRERLERARGLEAARVARARRHGTLLAHELRGAFARVDALLTPTLACRVPAAGAETVTIDGVEEWVVTALSRLTNPWNLTGVPAGSVPAGRDRDGAPVGMQVIGPWGGEPTVLDAMAALEALCGGPWPPLAAPPATAGA